ncbi:MAG: TlpA family protein disulfide reductase [Proteobacteria bacterium]|nr:TlpA family protein disulfide reductase [Pseudomonadota bacterium]
MSVLCAMVPIIACDNKEVPSKGRSRVVAVPAKAEAEDSLEGFCDVTAKEDNKLKFHLPELDNKGVLTAGTARWINVWATWCKPCIEEMPMLVQWKERLKKNGIDLTLEFLSVDDTIESVNNFLKKHPEIPSSTHLKNPDALGPWMADLGLDKGAGLPVHIFVGPQGFIRCVRAAAIGQGDYATIHKLLR